MKVTPEIEEPIIPNAMRYQGDLRLARKKLSFVLMRLVSQETPINTIK